MNLEEMQTYINRINSDLTLAGNDIEDLKQTLKETQLLINFQKSEIAKLKQEIEKKDKYINELEI